MGPHIKVVKKWLKMNPYFTGDDAEVWRVQGFCTILHREIILVGFGLLTFCIEFIHINLIPLFLYFNIDETEVQSPKLYPWLGIQF